MQADMLLSELVVCLGTSLRIPRLHHDVDEEELRDDGQNKRSEGVLLWKQPQHEQNDRQQDLKGTEKHEQAVVRLGLLRSFTFSASAVLIIGHFRGNIRHAARGLLQLGLGAWLLLGLPQFV